MSCHEPVVLNDGSPAAGRCSGQAGGGILQSATRTRYRRYKWTEAEDDILRAEYGKSRKESRGAIEKVLNIHPNWSRQVVISRARVLGVAQSRATPHQRWSAALDHYLLSMSGCQLDTIASRLGRSKKSVLARLRRLGRNSDFFGGFKTKDLVQDLRVSEPVVNRWVTVGWLERKKGRITEESLRWLCRYHPEEILFESLAPEVQNWLRLSLDFGRGAGEPRKGRRGACGPDE